MKIVEVAVWGKQTDHRFEEELRFGHLVRCGEDYVLSNIQNFFVPA
jgi:hypothetical protein